MGCYSSRPKLKKLKDRLLIGTIPNENEFKSVQRFDDWDKIRKAGQEFCKIYAIKVQSTQSGILGIEVAYEVANGAIVTGGNHSSDTIDTDEHCYEDVFEVDVDDFIVEMSGRMDKSLCSISFKTHKGQEAHFGASKKGMPFRFTLCGQTFGPFAGAFCYSDRTGPLNILEIPLVPAPVEALAV